MATVFKCPLKTNDVLFVIWISLLELIQHLDLLEACLKPRTRECISDALSPDYCYSYIVS